MHPRPDFPKKVNFGRPSEATDLSVLQMLALNPSSIDGYHMVQMTVVSRQDARQA